MERQSWMRWALGGAMALCVGCGDQESGGNGSATTGGEASSTGGLANAGGDETTGTTGGVGATAAEGGTAGSAAMAGQAGTAVSVTTGGTAGGMAQAGRGARGEGGEGGDPTALGGTEAGGDSSGAGTPSEGGVAGTNAPPTCDGCTIDGLCFEDADENPNNPCQQCDVNVSTSSWSDRDGATCDDGSFCNGSDHCDSGACSIHDGDPCDDGIACNGAETCDDSAGQCVPGTSPCPTNQTCNVTTDACETVCNGCLVDGSCYADAEPHPADPCRVCSAESATDGWTVAEDGTACGDGRVCTAGTCSCDGPWIGDDCAQCVVHVAPNGDDLAGGGSWTTAKQTVQAGIATGADIVSLGLATSCEVWVAEGTYTPGENRTDSFELASDVHLFGGFYGDETARQDRDWTTRTSVLSGDIGVSSEASDNLYHVVRGADRATLDGFTIADGCSSGNGIESDGAGMLNEGVSPTVRNCTFLANQGVGTGSNGGAVFNDGASPTFADCTFDGNSAASGGAIYSFNAASISVSRCVFTNNAALSTHAGAIYANDGTSVAIVDSRFIGNQAANNGAGVYATGATADIASCYFADGTARAGGGVWIGSSSTVHVVGSAFFQNTAAGAYGGGVYAEYSTLSVVNSTLTQNATDGSGAGLTHTDSTVSITNSILWANTAPWGDEQLFHYAGAAPTIANTTVEGGCTVSGCSAEDPLLHSDGLHLTEGSPARDSGDSTALPVDALDVDDDGDTSEALPLDLDGATRVVGAAVDRGAYEYQ